MDTLIISVVMTCVLSVGGDLVGKFERLEPIPAKCSGTYHDKADGEAIGSWSMSLTFSGNRNGSDIKVERNAFAIDITSIKPVIADHLRDHTQDFVTQQFVESLKRNVLDRQHRKALEERAI